MATIFNVEHRDDGIALLTINVPGDSQNTLKAEFIDEANAVFDELDKKRGLKGVIVRSGKPGSFIAGADINMLAACKEAADAAQLSRTGQAFCDRIAQFKRPIVAAIDGTCLGGGLELAMACRARICTDSSNTRLGLPEVQLGLLPGSGGTQRLPKLVGVTKALDLMLTGRHLRPHQAKKMGLVDDVVPSTILLQAAIHHLGHPRKGSAKSWRDSRQLSRWTLKHLSKARQLLFDQARKRTLAKTQGNYPAPEKIIECVSTGIAKGFKAGLAMEAQQFGELAVSPQAQQLMNIYFATTEMKKDSGVAADAPPRKVTKVGVLGAGLMGAGISYVSSARAQVQVRLKDRDNDGLNRGMQYVNRLIQQRLRRRSITAYTAGQQSRRVTPSLDYSGFHDVDVVIEAVFEDLNLKQQIVRECEQHSHPNTLFATNTSSIPISDIATAAQRPGQVIGMHYFSPVEKMPLLEIIATEQTQNEAIATAVQLGKAQGKTVIVVKDGAGFYVNRILAPYINEAGYLLEEGVAIDMIDTALVAFGFPVGPFALLDEVGIDVGSKVGPILFDAFGERMRPARVTERLLKENRLGKKSGRGFYQYQGKTNWLGKLSGKKRGKEVDESVYSLLGVKANSPMVDEHIVERCVLLMLNEAARCWDEQVIRSLNDGDIGAIFGIGFPPFLGGPFRYMDTQGITNVVAKLESYEAKVGKRYAPAESLKRMAKDAQAFYPSA